MLKRLAPTLFILSGMAGLTLQIAWFRLLAQSLGGTLAASTAVLSSFMAGLALGAWFFGKRAASYRDGVAAYGLLEAGAGLAALATLPLISWLDTIYALLAGPFEAHPTFLLGVKIVLAMLALVPATFFMGGTLPVLCEALATRAETAGVRTGGLYALNTGGAVLGTALALFFLLPELGLTMTVVCAAGLDLVVAGVVLALSLSRREKGGTSEVTSPVESAPVVVSSEAAASLRLHSRVLFLVGFAGISYEVLWTRILAFYFGSGTFAFGLTLAVVLTGLAVGGFLGGALVDRIGRPVLVLAGSQVALALTVIYQVWRFPRLPDFLYELAVALDRPIDFLWLNFLLLFGAVQLLLPSAVLMGMALPAAVKAQVQHQDARGAGHAVGTLVGANSLGTIPGAILAAYVLVPLFHTQGALFAVATVNLLIAAWALSGMVAGRLRSRALGVVALTLVVVLGVAFVAPAQQVFSGSGVFGTDGGNGALLGLDESTHGTVSLSRIVDGRGTWLSLSIDGVNVAGTSPPLLSCQTMQGQLPMLLHPNPQRVLHVGFGSGGTAAAVATHSRVKELVVAEINPTIPEVSGREFRSVNFGVLEDPRLRVVFEDGRNHLIGTRSRYDVILSDSIHPRYGGNANLYTTDYFRICRSKLAPGGLVSTWLPIYSLSEDSLRSIVASMREVFPATSVWYLNSTVNEFMILIGRTDDAPFDVERMQALFEEPAVAASFARVGIVRLEQVLDFFIGEGDDLDALVQDVPLHWDDKPWIEFESAVILDRNGSWIQNLKNLIRARSSVLPRLARTSPQFLESMETHESSTALQLKGQELFLASQIVSERTGVPMVTAGYTAKFKASLEANPNDAEPWEVFGYPLWVGEQVQSREASDE